MTRLPVAPLLLSLLLLSLAAVAAQAEEPSATGSVPESAAPAVAPTAGPEAPSGPTLDPRSLDLLPLDEFERADLVAEHADVAGRLRDLAGRLERVDRQLARRDDPRDAESQALRDEAMRVAEQMRPLLVHLTALLRSRGLTDDLMRAMAEAPRGESRVGRYGQRLVLLLEDLTPAQRRLFERLVAELEGAWLVTEASRARAQLALEQAGIEPPARSAVLSGFQRQMQLADSRFWRLVDYVLTTDQKAALHDVLPTPLRRGDPPMDHLYALPGLTPPQIGRLKALFTEVEAESAPDEAALKRLRTRLRERDLPAPERRILQAEQAEAQARLTALRRFTRDTVREILTAEQHHEVKAIPPRVGINERREDPRRLFEGMPLDLAQQAALEVLQKEARERGRAVARRVQDLRGSSSDYGPESPQTAMMDMMVQATQGENLAVQRELLGRAFLEVLTPEQTTRWVLGHYGRPR
jgi:hypothetical protein